MENITNLIQISVVKKDYHFPNILPACRTKLLDMIELLGLYALSSHAHLRLNIQRKRAVVQNKQSQIAYTN